MMLKVHRSHARLIRDGLFKLFFLFSRECLTSTEATYGFFFFFNLYLCCCVGVDNFVPKISTSRLRFHRKAQCRLKTVTDLTDVQTEISLACLEYLGIVRLLFF